MNMEIRFSTEEEHKNFLESGLKEFNSKYNKHERKDFGFYVYDGDKIVGGHVGE